MHYFIYADKDATIYSGSTPNKLGSTVVEEQNTGLDSILELDKWTADTGVNPMITTKAVSRILVNFDLTSLSSSIGAGDITSPSYNLRLYSTENTTEIPISYTILGYPISQSWEMGIGKKVNDPITKTGVTWNWRDVSGSNHWDSTGGDYIKTIDATNYQSSQTYTYETADVNMDVTTTVNNWLDSTISNYGFILKRSSSLEINDIEYGSLKFFSRDSHTIYNPKLEVKWRDDSFETGSLTALDVSNEDYLLYMRNKKPEYKRNSKTKFRVYGRKKIVDKTYATSSEYLSVNFLPSQSYYSIKDHLTGEELIPFDDYTTISCDSTGNYFNLWMNSFQPDRYYRIAYKIVSGSNETYFDDNKFVFKIVR